MMIASIRRLFRSLSLRIGLWFLRQATLMYRRAQRSTLDPELAALEQQAEVITEQIDNLRAEPQTAPALLTRLATLREGLTRVTNEQKLGFDDYVAIIRRVDMIDHRVRQFVAEREMTN